MAVKDGKTRIMITLPDELIEKIDANAEPNKRNTSNEIEYVLENYYNTNKSLDGLKGILLSCNDFNFDINLFEGVVSNISSLYDNQKDKTNLLMITSLILQNKELNDKLTYMFKYLSDNYMFKKD